MMFSIEQNMIINRPITLVCLFFLLQFGQLVVYCTCINQK
jgi:hypothetical protein